MNPDLLCVVADKDIKATIDELLTTRKRVLGIAEISHETYVHARRDSGCYHTGVEMLRGLLGESNSRGMLVFDRAWKGNPHGTATETEDAVRNGIERAALRADVVVLEPEIEVWVWSGSRHVDKVLGWERAEPGLREWLERQGLWPQERTKPNDPKLAMEKALREARVVRSSSLYRQLASQVSLTACQDPAFDRFCRLLRQWFPA